MTRLVLDRLVSNKLNTQLQKADRAPIFSLYRQTRVSSTPTKGVVVWNPSHALLEGIVAILEREQTFVRKPDSDSAMNMRRGIDEAKGLLLEPDPTAKPPVAEG